jgi:hypothetical protein
MKRPNKMSMVKKYRKLNKNTRQHTTTKNN